MTALPTHQPRLFESGNPATGRRQRAHRLVSGLTVSTVVATIAIPLFWTGHELPGCFGVVLAVAVALAGNRSVLSNVPQAFVLLLVGIIAVAMALPLAGASFHAQSAARALLTMFALAAVVLAFVRRRSIQAVYFASGAELLACLPACFFALIGACLSWAPLPIATSWFFRAIDNVNHLNVVAQLQLAGGLSYGDGAYPRGWHTLVATLADATAASEAPNAKALRALLSVLSTSTWLLYGMLVLSVSMATLHLERRFSRGKGGACAGAVAGGTMLLPSFLFYMLGYGAETKLLFAVVLVTACMELVMRERERTSLMLAACLVAASHSWQVGVPLLAGCLALAFRVDWREAGGGTKHRRELARWASIALVAAVLSSPPVISMFASIQPTDAVASAAERGVDVGGIPWAWLVMALVATVFTLSRGRVLDAASFMALAILAMGVFSLLVAAKAEVAITSYYPNRILWFACLLGVPLAYALLESVLHRRVLPTASAAVRRSIAAVFAAVLALVLACGGLLTYLAVFRTWTPVSAGQVIAAVTTKDAREAQVVWKVGETHFDDQFARRLLEYYRTGTDQQGSPHAASSHKGECAALKRAEVPSVLSRENAAVVRSAFTCVSDVRVIHVSSTVR